jgi:hypothetical protein
MLKGYPIVESNSVPSVTTTGTVTDIVFVDCSQILHASDPVVDIQSSEEASLQMDSAPATPPTPLVSMFQQNMLAIRADQFQFWAKRHTGCVAIITGFAV